jgi:SpoVK/Ycf46/Vps4 family AAA+-type ATPase
MCAKLIDILDAYKAKQLVKYKEYSMLLSVINYDYYENNLFSVNFSGKQDFNYIHNINTFAKHSELFSKDAYSFWKSTHEIDISLNDLKPKTVEIKKTPVVIDVSVNSLTDLIDIIEKNECKPEIEYNIDVQLLHNIKGELKQLNSMIGMGSMKKSILDQLIYFVQDLHVGKTTSEFKHTIIAGPPGTGKTEVAKIIGTMYSKIGILTKNHFKKVTRSDLIAGYLGQTAIKTRKVIDECLGGVLFIDEAYALASETDSDVFSKECIDTLCEALSDHKENLMVIIAGYEKELDNTFFKVNRGMRSRFMWRFVMDDYSHKELMDIFKKMVLENGWEFRDENQIGEGWFRDKKDNFKNFGRDMEILFSCVKIKHGRRVYGKPVTEKKRLTREDIDNGYLLFLENKDKTIINPSLHSIYI